MQLALLASTVLSTLLSAPDWRADLAATCDELAAKHSFSGAVLVARGDEVLVQRTYGFRDADNEVAIQPETRFLVASLTKPVVAFTTLRLAQEQLVGLTDTVAQHIPGLAAAPVGEATLHQLLTHTSGLPHYSAWPGFLDDVTVGRTEEELLGLLAATELRTEPGSAFSYSGPGYLLLGMVLERAAEAPLSELVERWVTAPLGMERTELLDPRAGVEDVPDLAVPLSRGGTEPAPAPLRHPSTLRATGGLVTTIGDLRRFARAIQRAELLEPEYHATLLRPARGSYACGLIVYQHPWTGQRFARHKGNMDGVAAHIVFGLEDSRIAVALSNVGGAPVNAINDRLIMQVPSESEPADPDESEAGTDGLMGDGFRGALSLGGVRDRS